MASPNQRRHEKCANGKSPDAKVAPEYALSILLLLACIHSLHFQAVVK